MVNKYYQKAKKSFKKKHGERCKNFSEEEKEKKYKKGWDRYKNLS